MYEFLDRLVTIALPRVRDFRGVSGRGFDGRGNYNMGVKEQIIFPEIEYDKIDAIRGHEHHDHDDREDRRRSQGAARRVQVSVQELRTRNGEAGTDQPRSTSARSSSRSTRRSARRSKRSIANPQMSDEDRYAARLKLQALPRNANPTRLRNRCAHHRPSARRVSASSASGATSCARYAMRGEIPGIVKASW